MVIHFERFFLLLKLFLKCLFIYSHFYVFWWSQLLFPLKWFREIFPLLFFCFIRFWIFHPQKCHSSFIHWLLAAVTCSLNYRFRKCSTFIFSAKTFQMEFQLSWFGNTSIKFHSLKVKPVLWFTKKYLWNVLILFQRVPKICLGFVLYFKYEIVKT